MTTRLGRWIWLSSAVVLAMTLSACGASSEESNREVIRKENKSITVIDAGKAAPSKVAVASIETVKGARGMAFLSENSIIASRPAADLPPRKLEGEEQLYNNLYVYDLDSKTDKAIYPAEEYQGSAKLTPDKKHLVYKAQVEEDARGYILNLADAEGKPVPIGGADQAVNIGDFSVDDQQILFTTVDGSLHTSDLNGNTETEVDSPKSPILTAARAGGGIYYVMEENLYYKQTGESHAQKLVDGVIWVIPSPDGKQLALVRRATETTMLLTITDLQGNEVLKLNAATQIYGTSWSPDGSKLVYNVISEQAGDKGVYMADTASGEVTPITIDLQYASDPISWSPSGNKLVTSTSINNEFVTYVITLKD
ncbi:hypothetical protein ACFO9Q_11400 [Paenibacillus sp. GCM10023252]|uniref:hypothetical protein n=1 Tax=Paenibacillus sp. GCM10023252 TaxID=3252649 RepID=UPI0036100BBE